MQAEKLLGERAKSATSSYGGDVLTHLHSSCLFCPTNHLDGKFTSDSANSHSHTTGMLQDCPSVCLQRKGMLVLDSLHPLEVLHPSHEFVMASTLECALWRAWPRDLILLSY